MFLKKIHFQKIAFFNTLVFILFLFPYTGNSQTYTFNTCGATARFGPTQTQANTSYTSTNLNGSDTIIKLIKVFGDYNVYIPNSFTPNGNGHNEKFLPVVRNVRSFEFRVFNRWGEQLFLSTDSNEGWDGKHKGQDCQEGFYSYKLTIKPINEDEKIYVGALNLIR
jgi:gliding motility-associated-like protein